MLFQRSETALFAGIIAGCALFFAPDWSGKIVCGAFLIAIITICAWHRKRIALLIFAGFCAGSISTIIQQKIFYPVAPGESVCSVEYLQLRLTDPRLCDAPDIATPNLIRAEAQKPFAGRVYCRMPDDFQDKVRYGDLVSGSAQVSPVAGIEGSFGNYLRSRRAEKLIRFRDLKVVGNKSDFYGKLLRCRDKLVNRCVYHFRDRRLKNLAAALFFGISGGISGAEKREFVNSGTVHLFSVSGMHVAVIAALAFFLFRRAKYQVRCAALIIICGIYTILTGANTPALRAFFMIAVWAALRMSALWMPPLGVLSLCGAAMLLINPYLLLDMGAQYSFVITAALLFIAEFAYHKARQNWHLSSMFFSGARHEAEYEALLINRLLAAISIPVTAFFAGAGISLFWNGKLYVGQIIANILLAFLTLPLFSLLIVSSILPPVGMVAETLLALISSWCSFCAEIFPPLAGGAPASRLILLYYMVFFLALSRKKLRNALFYFSAAVLILLMPFAGGERRDAVMVVTGDSKTPPGILFFNGGSGRAELVNVPDYHCAEKFSEFLRRRKAERISALYLSSNRKSAAGGLHYLKNEFQPEKILVYGCGKSAVNKRLKSYLKDFCQREDAANALDHPGRCRILSTKERLDIEYFFSGSKLKTELFVDRESGCWRIVFHSGSGESVVRHKFGVPGSEQLYEF